LQKLQIEEKVPSFVLNSNANRASVLLIKNFKPREFTTIKYMPNLRFKILAKSKLDLNFVVNVGTLLKSRADILFLNRIIFKAQNK
jgi:hypothetical protein